MLTLSDYQKEALKTSDETNTLEYCVLGLVSEAGEVAGVVKKWLRGDYDEATMRAKMLDELGDVLWYVAVLDTRVEWFPDASDLFPVNSFKAEEFEYMESYDGNLGVGQSVRGLVQSTGDLGMYFDDNSQSDMWSCAVGVISWVILIGTLTGHTLADIAAHNIAKLRDRQERGVIRGSGDGR